MGIYDLVPLTDEEIDKLNISIKEIKKVNSVAEKIYPNKANPKGAFYEDLSNNRITVKIVDIDGDRYVYVPITDQEKDKWNFIKVLKKAGRPKK